MMVTPHPGKKLEIYVAASAQWHGRPLYSAIVERCREKGIAGATVIHCVEGYGTHHVLHTERLFSLSDDLPVRIEIIEQAERFDAVIEALHGLLDVGLLIATDVDILRNEEQPPTANSTLNP